MSKNKSIYVGLEATGSKNIDHMTVIWMGNELPPITIMEILKNYRYYSTLEWRKSIELFGNNKNLLVATIELDNDSWVRKFRNELMAAGCKDHSEFEWNPHVTIQTVDSESTPDDIYIPKQIELAKPYISIGGNRIYG